MSQPYRGATGERPRIVLMPVDNLTGRQVPRKDLQIAIEVGLRRDFDVVSGDIVEQFLSRHRLRFTGGLDSEAAAAARDELGADVVLITDVEVYRTAGTPTIGLAMRLVTADAEPIILWMDHESRAGDQDPGLLRLGVIDDMKELQDRVLRRLLASLSRAVDGKGSAGGDMCGASRTYRPSFRYRAPGFDGGQRYRVAVVPFLNQSGRRGAGDAVALEFVRQLVATGRFDVLEPGVVRDYLLRARVIMPGGVSLETTRLLLGALSADLVVSGVVLDYDDNGPMHGPAIRFTATMLDGESGEVVWNSSSFNRGDDTVVAFGLGRVATPGVLTCRMVSAVMERFTAPGPRVSPAADDWRQSRRPFNVSSRKAARGAGGGDGSAK